jgi:hypothetical protein
VQFIVISNIKSGKKTKEENMAPQNKQFLNNAIVSTGSDITHKVEMVDGISKKDKMYIAKDILCSMINSGSFCGVEGRRKYILDSYTIADMLIRQGGL